MKDTTKLNLILAIFALFWLALVFKSHSQPAAQKVSAAHRLAAETFRIGCVEGYIFAKSNHVESPEQLVAICAHLVLARHTNDVTTPIWIEAIKLESK